MAGTYPDYPNYKIPLDVIGGVIINISNPSAPTQYASSVLRSLSGESFGGAIGVSGGGNVTIAIVFPFNMDITGISYYGGGSRAASLTGWSSDTTNGVDGTWTALSVPNNGGGAVEARVNINAVNLPSCKSIRMFQFSSLGGSSSISQFHVYGTTSAGQNLNRLELWNPSLDQRISPAYFDWGDTPRGSSADRTFRVKNLSDTLTANNVVLSFDGIYDSSPSFSGSHALSTDGVIFSSTVTIPILYPNGVSSPITLRRSTPSNAQLSLWTTRLKAEATTWTV